MTQDLLPHLEAALQDRYRIERPVGVGGMATIYFAEDLKHHRNVAAKPLRPELAAKRLLNRMKIAGNLDKPPASQGRSDHASQQSLALEHAETVPLNVGSYLRNLLPSYAVGAGADPGS